MKGVKILMVVEIITLIIFILVALFINRKVNIERKRDKFLILLYILLVATLSIELFIQVKQLYPLINQLLD